MTQNQVAFLNYQETARSNRERERETERHDRQMEAAQLASIRATEQGNILKFVGDVVGSAVSAEGNRLKFYSDYLSTYVEDYHKTVQEKETQRYNTFSILLSTAQLAEQHRSNTQNESIKLGQLYETVRHDYENEQISWGNLDESHRSNVANEMIKLWNYQETVRSNFNSEMIAVEKQEYYENATDAYYLLDKYKAETSADLGYSELQSKYILGELNAYSSMFSSLLRGVGSSVLGSLLSGSGSIGLNSSESMSDWLNNNTTSIYEPYPWER